MSFDPRPSSRAAYRRRRRAEILDACTPFADDIKSRRVRRIVLALTCIDAAFVAAFLIWS